MSNDTQATLNVPTDVLRPIIEARVAQSVIEALGGQSEILTRAVHFFMNVSVDNDGKATGYNGKPWIQWAIMHCVQNAAKSAIEQHLLEHSEELKKALVIELRKKNSPLARQLADGMVGALAHPDVLKWRLKVDCGIGS